MGSRTLGAILVSSLLIAILLGHLYITEPSVREVVSKLNIGPVRMAIGATAVIAGAFAIYRVSSKAIRLAILRAEGAESDVEMLLGLWKFVVALISILIFVSVFFEIGIVPATVGAFGGLLLGWSLQQPVSGFAAWLLVTLRRPFRVGDRVQLPSFGLVGDIIEIGTMYTQLNQVGGAVGSEEPVGRHILIPNAMLFGSLIINYTPRLQRESTQIPEDDKKSLYILDEVTVRITFDSDWEAAEDILLRAAREVTSGIIRETGQDPYIRADFYDYGVYMRLRYMTFAKKRPKIAYLITKKIFNDFSKNESVDLAIPYVYSYKKAAGTPFALHEARIDR